MRVRIESVAEHWAQRPGNRRTANCLAGSGLVSSPAVRSERTADSRLPSVRDGERPVLVPRGASSRNPKASDPSDFCSVRDFVVRATATRAHPSDDPSTDGKVVVCLVAPGGRES